MKPEHPCWVIFVDTNKGTTLIQSHFIIRPTRKRVLCLTCPQGEKAEESDLATVWLPARSGSQECLTLESHTWKELLCTLIIHDCKMRSCSCGLNNACQKLNRGLSLPKPAYHLCLKKEKKKRKEEKCARMVVVDMLLPEHRIKQRIL